MCFSLYKTSPEFGDLGNLARSSERLEDLWKSRCCDDCRAYQGWVFISRCEGESRLSSYYCPLSPHPVLQSVLGTAGLQDLALGNSLTWTEVATRDLQGSSRPEAEQRKCFPFCCEQVRSWLLDCSASNTAAAVCCREARLLQAAACCRVAVTPVSPLQPSQFPISWRHPDQLPHGVFRHPQQSGGGGRGERVVWRVRQWRVIVPDRNSLHQQLLHSVNCQRATVIRELSNPRLAGALHSFYWKTTRKISLT